MNLSETCATGWREIRAYKTRSILSFSAISIGAASILYTFAQTHGMKESLNRSLEIMGPGRMTISAKQNYISKGLSPGLTFEDSQAIRRAMPELFMVSPKVRRWGGRVYFGSIEVKDVPFDGVSPEWRRRDWVYRLDGRFIDDWDVANAARVCVVTQPGGWEKKPFWASFASYWLNPPLDRFVDRHDLLGRDLRLGNHLFKVIGILHEPPKDRDPRLAHWDWNAVLVPVTAFHRYLRRAGTQDKSDTSIGSIAIDSGSEKTLPAAKRRIESILRYRHRGEEDYEIRDDREAVQGELNDSQRYVVVGVILGCVALLSGGIGIMNVTLATIFLRVREIGIRRALGARKIDIMFQFVIEAMLLGAAGGVAGIGLGLAGISYMAKHSDRDIAHITWYHGLACIAIAIAICSIFSLYPASQAANLDPVLALKDE